MNRSWPWGTVTGRLTSGRGPDLQQIPLRTVEGRAIRSAFRVQAAAAEREMELFLQILATTAMLHDDPHDSWPEEMFGYPNWVWLHT